MILKDTVRFIKNQFSGNRNPSFLIAITGDSCVGKTTLANYINNIYNKECKIIAGDGFHKFNRNHKIWQKITHLNPSANNIKKLYDVAIKLKNNQITFVKKYCHKKGKLSSKKITFPAKINIFDGLHNLYESDLNTVWDLKIFIDAAKETKDQRKIVRDTEKRNHNLLNVLKVITKRRGDFKKYILPQKNNADIFLDEGLHESKIYLKKFNNIERIYDFIDNFKDLKLEEKEREIIITLPNKLLNSNDEIIFYEYVEKKYQYLNFNTKPYNLAILVLTYLILIFYEDYIKNLLPSPSLLPIKKLQNQDNNPNLLLKFNFKKIINLNFFKNNILRSFYIDSNLIKDFKDLADYLSKEEFCLGSGGNISVKNDNLMLVKSSGVDMKNITYQNGFSAIDLTKVSLQNLNNTNYLDYVIEPYKNKPSMEIGFHLILKKYVIHHHSYLCKILCCSIEGEEIIKKIFPKFYFINYCNPGIDLAQSINQALLKIDFQNSDFLVFFLENHGMIVCADDKNKVIEVNNLVIKTLQENFGDSDIADDLMLKCYLDDFYNKNKILFPDQIIYSQSKSCQELDKIINTYQKIRYLMDKNKLTPKFLHQQDIETIKSMPDEIYRQKIINNF